jgi:hypothetical protein
VLRIAQLLLAAALLALAPTPAAVAQGYGPTLASQQHFEMHRGDVLDIDVGKDFDWAEVDNEAVAAFMREDNRLRLVAIKAGKAEVVLTDDKLVVWKAQVVVR